MLDLKQPADTVEILTGFPQTTEKIICLGNQPYYSEGLIIRFFKDDHSSWLGNFEKGTGNIIRTYLLAEKKCLIFANGAGYIINIETQDLIMSLGSDYTKIIQDTNKNLILSDSIGITIVNLNGEVWNSERVSWDGIKDLKLEGDIISGLSYDPMNTNQPWVPFSLNLITKHTEGGSYKKYQ